MRIFLAGATGAIGRQLVPTLVADGHDVVGLTRHQAKADRLHDAGAEAVVCDLYDPRLAEIVAAARPDVVMHYVTDLPSRAALVPLKLLSLNRARTRGTDLLVRAAADAGAKRFVAQSIAFSLPSIAQRAVNHLEAAALAYPGVVIRYGTYYGPGAWTDEPHGSGPTVHVADAARRTVELLDAKPGTYDVVDPA
jgi:uncharacterized protein YbjT (DUF2867 family)